MIGLLRRRTLLLATRWIAAARRRLLGPHAKAILCETENGRLLIHVSDFSIGKKLAFDGRYQTENLQELLRLVDGESRVLIVGAHVGAFLIPLAKKAKEVVGVEANPETRQLLEANLQLNQVHNARILGNAASDKPGEVEFLFNPSNTGGSKMRQAGEPWEFVYDSPSVLRVRAERLDSLLEGAFDLVIIDVEGAEFQALRGMGDLLKSCRILQVEYIPFAQEAAGVAPAAFAELMAEHFEYARAAGQGRQGGKVWKRGEFVTMLTELQSFSNSLGEDFLFSKSLADLEKN